MENEKPSDEVELNEVAIPGGVALAPLGPEEDKRKASRSIFWLGVLRRFATLVVGFSLGSVVESKIFIRQNSESLKVLEAKQAEIEETQKKLNNRLDLVKFCLENGRI